MMTYKPFKRGTRALTHSKMFNAHKHRYPKLVKRMKISKPIQY